MDAQEVLRAEALFCSHLQPSDTTTSAQVRDIVHEVVFRLGQAGVEELVAQECGDHPELAAERMRWCCQQVERAFVPAHA